MNKYVIVATALVGIIIFYLIINNSNKKMIKTALKRSDIKIVDISQVKANRDIGKCIAYKVSYSGDEGGVRRVDNNNNSVAGIIVRKNVIGVITNAVDTTWQYAWNTEDLLKNMCY